MKKYLLLAALVVVWGLALANMFNKPTQTKTDTKSCKLPKKHDAVLRIGEDRVNCSGFVISNTEAITAKHCVADEYGGTVSKVKIFDNKNVVIKSAKVIPSPNGLDIAKLVGNFKDFEKLEYTPGQIDIDFSDPFVSCGYPLASRYKYCIPLTLIENSTHLMKAKGYLIYGMSGGPVINTKKNTVVGINMGISEGFVVFTPLIGIDGLFDK